MGIRAYKATEIGESAKHCVHGVGAPRQVRVVGMGAPGAAAASSTKPPPRPRLSHRGFPIPCTSPNLPAGGGAGPGDVREGRGSGSAAPGRASHWLSCSDFLAAAAPSWWRVCPFRPFTRHCRSLRAAQRPPSRSRRVHAAAIPPSAMARPLQDRSRAEPTAAVSGSPAFPVGGTVALPPPVCQPPLALPPRLNCIYRCGRGQEPPRSRSNDTHGSNLWPATQPRVGQQEAPTPEANGHLLMSPPSLEQAIGARLRHMGDQFRQEHEQRLQQEPRGPAGALWGPFYHFVFHVLGVLYNLPVEGLAARGLN